MLTIIDLVKKYVTLIIVINRNTSFIKITSLLHPFCVTRGGIVNAGGWGTRKNTVHFPRGVHEARQKHAPCVDFTRK